MRAALAIVPLLGGCHKLFSVEHAPVDAPPPPYRAEVLADEPVGYYRLGEATGVSAVDETGGPPGQYVSTFRLGEPGAIADDTDTAVFFGPGDTAVLFDDVHEFDGLKPFSIEAWVRPMHDGRFHNIAAKFVQPPAATGYILYTLDRRLAFARAVTEANQTLIEAQDALVPGVYQHVVATFDGTDMRLFVDGVQVGTKRSVVALPDQTVKFTIGSANGTASSSTYHGLIDEVAIYDEALPPQRVFEHHAAAITAPRPASR